MRAAARRLLPLGLYLAALAVIAYWPTHVDAPVRGQLFAVLHLLHLDGVPGFIDYAFVESLANVLLFVPLGAWAGWLPRRPRPLAPALAGLAVSCLIEAGQLLFLSGRTASWADVAANVAGAVVGGTAVYALRRARDGNPARAAVETDR
ncbi:VanZ family protein [Paenarthrobacter sp. DKR-5]|uniref:VanZ family protein n=1 Tax=Paenarthrobacter sp. DKR-5 TaxID=2835535 RepID=UPI001BDC5C39|nr:VanZ family protein [Paenarthrobacter sp. DKR-5]MBT1002482.1 VanZ family protein [Paenarthrobacter sp. DKR-5]